MLRPCRIGLQLLSQMTHIDPQIVAVLHGVRPPHLIQQLALGKHFAGIIQQRRQQAKLDRRQVDLFAAAQDAAGGDIDLRVSEAHHRLIGLRRAVATQRDAQAACSSPMPKGLLK